MAIIGHIDLDAFFASVEERDNAYLKGMPIVVGADPEGGEGRGVVATASYAARAYGIHSAMPIRKAWYLSEEARKKGLPAVAFLTSGVGKYAEESQAIFSIVRSRVADVEMRSVDEAYLDFSYARSYKRAHEEAARLKKEIRSKRKLIASFGIGPNKMVAKIASDAGKPDGLVVVLPSQVASFLAPLPIRVLPGVGPKTADELAMMRVKTVGELAQCSWEDLTKHFGKHGFDLYEKARGIADDELSGPRTAKSIGEHETFRHDTRSFKEVEATMRNMAHSIVTTMHRKGFKSFRTIVLTVRFDDFETKDRSLTGDDVLSDEDALERRALKLLLPFFEKRENPAGKAVRMLGLRIENLIENGKS